MSNSSNLIGLNRKKTNNKPTQQPPCTSVCFFSEVHTAASPLKPLHRVFCEIVYLCVNPLHKERRDIVVGHDNRYLTHRWVDLVACPSIRDLPHLPCCGDLDDGGDDDDHLCGGDGDVGGRILQYLVDHDAVAGTSSCPERRMGSGLKL